MRMYVQGRVRNQKLGPTERKGDREIQTETSSPELLSDNQNTRSARKGKDNGENGRLMPEWERIQLRDLAVSVRLDHVHV